MPFVLDLKFLSQNLLISHLTQFKASKWKDIFSIDVENYSYFLCVIINFLLKFCYFKWIPLPSIGFWDFMKCHAFKDYMFVYWTLFPVILKLFYQRDSGHPCLLWHQFPRDSDLSSYTQPRSQNIHLKEGTSYSDQNYMQKIHDICKFWGVLHISFLFNKSHWIT